MANDEFTSGASSPISPDDGANNTAKARWDSMSEGKRAEIVSTLFGLVDEGRRVHALRDPRRQQDADRREQANRVQEAEQKLEAAGLMPLYDDVAQGMIVGGGDGILPIRINANVPPLALLAAAFCRAERCEAMAIVLAQVGNDGPGKRLQDELVCRFGPEKCLIATWPDGCKDANDALMLHGPVSCRRPMAGRKYPRRTILNTSRFPA